MYLYEVRLARVIFAFEPRIFFLWSKYYVLALGRFVLLCSCVNPKNTADVDVVVLCALFFLSKYMFGDVDAVVL